MAGQGVEQPLGGGLLQQQRGRLQRVDAGVVGPVLEQVHVLHVDAFHLAHLGQEERKQARLGKLDDELVDGPASAPLQDLDAHHVAPDRADAAGHRAQGAGPVRQPDPEHVAHHRRKATSRL